jgi:hypothetical protein
LREKQGKKEERKKALQSIQKKGKNPPFHADDSGHIGGSNVSAALLGDIYSSDSLADKPPKGDGTKEKGSQGKKYGEGQE